VSCLRTESMAIISALTCLAHATAVNTKLPAPPYKLAVLCAAANPFALIVGTIVGMLECGI